MEKSEEAIIHLIELKTQGLMSATESHGIEMPGPLNAAADCARDTALFLLLGWVVLQHFSISGFLPLLILSGGWIIWKSGRSAWLGWMQLQRLHRLLEQERWEIQHNRPQEREELRVLYAAKGLEGRLLEDVLDVFMADDNRLLQIMIEEELCLNIASQEHPLKQGLGAALGGSIAACLCLLLLYLYPPLGMFIASTIILGASSGLSAYFSGNELIPAMIWNLGIGLLAFSFVYFLLL